jgi:hypothetical protein
MYLRSNSSNFDVIGTPSTVTTFGVDAGSDAQPVTAIPITNTTIAKTAKTNLSFISQLLFNLHRHKPIFFPLCLKPFSFVNKFYKILGQMAYNVPAVCDGLTARIEKCVAFLGLANCAGTTAWEWSVAE